MRDRLLAYTIAGAVGLAAAAQPALDDHEVRASIRSIDATDRVVVLQALRVGGAVGVLPGETFEADVADDAEIEPELDTTGPATLEDLRDGDDVVVELDFSDKRAVVGSIRFAGQDSGAETADTEQ